MPNPFLGLLCFLRSVSSSPNFTRSFVFNYNYNALDHDLIPEGKEPNSQIDNIMKGLHPCGA